MMLHQGSVKWMVVRQRDGSITWAVAGSRDNLSESVIGRGSVKTGAEGLRSVVNAVGAFIIGLRSQV